MQCAGRQSQRPAIATGSGANLANAEWYGKIGSWRSPVPDRFCERRAAIAMPEVVEQVHAIAVVTDGQHTPVPITRIAGCQEYPYFARLSASTDCRIACCSVVRSSRHLPLAVSSVYEAIAPPNRDDHSRSQNFNTSRNLCAGSATKSS